MLLGCKIICVAFIYVLWGLCWLVCFGGCFITLYLFGLTLFPGLCFWFCVLGMKPASKKDKQNTDEERLIQENTHHKRTTKHYLKKRKKSHSDNYTARNPAPHYDKTICFGCGQILAEGKSKTPVYKACKGNICFL